MTAQSLLPEPGRVNEPHAAQEYSTILSQAPAELRKALEKAV